MMTTIHFEWSLVVLNNELKNYFTDHTSINDSLLFDFFSFSDSDSDDELDDGELVDDEPVLDSSEGDRVDLFPSFSFTGFFRSTFNDDDFFSGTGDGDLRLTLEIGAASTFIERLGGERCFSSSPDES